MGQLMILDGYGNPLGRYKKGKKLSKAQRAKMAPGVKRAQKKMKAALNACKRPAVLKKAHAKKISYKREDGTKISYSSKWHGCISAHMK